MGPVQKTSGLDGSPESILFDPITQSTFNELWQMVKCLATAFYICNEDLLIMSHTSVKIVWYVEDGEAICGGRTVVGALRCQVRKHVHGYMDYGSGRWALERGRGKDQF